VNIGNIVLSIVYHELGLRLVVDVVGMEFTNVCWFVYHGKRHEFM